MYLKIDDIAAKYNIDVILVPRKKIVKNIKKSLDNEKVVGAEQESTCQKIMGKLFSGLNKLKSAVMFDEKAIYLIDRNLIQNHFTILTDPTTYANE